LVVVLFMASGRWGWIVPDGLWEIARPLLPPARVRPQGGGVANTDDEAVFAAIIYVLVSGCAWRALPPCFGATKSTMHRRFVIWSRAGVWGRLHQKILQLLDEQNLIGWSRAVLDSAHVRAKRGRTSESKPRRLHADKAYDIPHLRRWLWGKHIGVRIARKVIDSSERLGQRRWVIERTMSWLTGWPTRVPSI
jgi:transposase